MEFNNKQINSGYGLLQTTLLIIILLLLLLGGCASKNINIKKESPLTKDGDVSEEKIDNIKMSEFILGAGDEIEISVYRHDDLRKTVNITSPGKIMFPLIGEIRVVDKGIFELRDELEERLSKYLVDLHCMVLIAEAGRVIFTSCGTCNRAYRKSWYWPCRGYSEQV